MLTRKNLALAQGAYYVITGTWAILHLRSFERVTGPKEDDWLVKTVGVLVTVIGAVLIRAGLRERPDQEAAFLAAGSAAGLSVIGTYYPLVGRISRIYLLDAAVEAAIVVAWMALPEGESPEETRQRDLSLASRESLRL